MVTERKGDEMSRYERTYGHKYDEPAKRGMGQYASAADIAKLIREDIKRDIADGMLPKGPQYSVTSESFSGGQAIRITVKGWADAWQVCDGTEPGTSYGCRNPWCKGRNDPAYAHAAEEHMVLTVEAKAVEMTLKRIHGAYNHDGSDSQTDYFDVNYYGQVEFEDARSAAFWAEEKAKKAARRAAIDAAAEQAVESVKVYKRDGQHVIHLATEVDGHLRLVCGARVMRYTPVSKTDAAPTCSRCCKKAQA